MKVLLVLSLLLLLASSFPFIRGNRHSLLVAAVAGMAFLSGFGIKGEITSLWLLIPNVVVNVVAATLLVRKGLRSG